MVVDWTGVGCGKSYGGLDRKERMDGERGGRMEEKQALFAVVGWGGGVIDSSFEGGGGPPPSEVASLVLLALLLDRFRLRFLPFLEVAVVIVVGGGDCFVTTESPPTSSPIEEVVIDDGVAESTSVEVLAFESSADDDAEAR